MRQIHPVGFHEKFVASGAYLFEPPSDETPNISSRWTIHELPDKSQLIRTESERLLNNQWVNLRETLVNAKGQVERVDILTYTTDSYRYQKSAVTCIRHDHSVEIYHKLNRDKSGEWSGVYEEKLPYDYWYFDLGLPLLKFPVNRYTKNIKFPVFWCSVICWPDNEGIDVTIRVENWLVDFVRTDTIDIDDRQHETNLYHVTTYESELGLYKKHKLVWLDKHKVVLKSEFYESEHLLSNTVLTQYTRRPEPKS